MNTPAGGQEHKIGFAEQLANLDTRYWIVNIMEMLERLAYYGVRAVVALYIVWPPDKGGLQFTHVQKGVIFAWWAYVQSMLPVFTGGFADRYGHKNTVAVAIAIKIAGYLAMASFRDFSGFFLGAMLLAAGTAIFKPGVQGTLAFTLKKGNASVGWGIFYQLVNIGGFVGPILAGFLRGWEWRWVFISCAIIVAVNYLWLPFYKEPTKEPDYAADTDSGKAMAAIAEIVSPLASKAWLVVHTVALVLSARYFDSTLSAYLDAPADLAEQALADMMLAVMILMSAALFAGAFLMLTLKRDKYAAGASDPFSVFILSIVGIFQHRVFWFVMAFSGFWLMFNQVFDLLPNVIDDWMDTSQVLVALGDTFSSSLVPTLLAVFLGLGFGAVAAIIILLAMRPDHREAKDVPVPAYLVVLMGVGAATWIGGHYFGDVWEPVSIGVGVALTAAALGMRWKSKHLAIGAAVVGTLFAVLVVRDGLLAAAPELVQLGAEGGQINPEWMINLNPGLIMFTMVFFAYLSSFITPLTSILIGMVIATAGCYLAGTALLGWSCLAGIFVFSVGEMLSSPKKMEYLASIAKPGQQGLFMGYANMPVAVGWITGSVLAGSLYEANGDKISLARRFLTEKLDMAQSAVEDIAESDMMSTLAAKLDVTVSQAQQTLQQTYDPGSIWLLIAGIGLASIVLMVGYTYVIRHFDKRAAAGA